jgi:7-cyano-7-deazaguanine synthase
MALIALLSGGLDSTVALALALETGTRGADALALTFRYGQRSERSEVRAAEHIARKLGVEHRSLDLPFLRELAVGPLVGKGGDLPRPDEVDLEPGAGKAREGAAAVWIPHRNGLFVAIAATLADARGGGKIVVGFNREEGETFPDNSLPYLEAVNHALRFATREDVEVVSPTANLDKTDILREGFRTSAPLDRIHSCYEDRDPFCGTCESCARLRRGLERSGHLRDFLAMRGWERFPG